MISESAPGRIIRTELHDKDGCPGADEIGGRVCLEADPGVLYLAWYRMVDCDESGE